jgi:hypothetical protein
MKGKNIDLNDFQGVSPYNHALASDRCEYCLQIYFYRLELSSPFPYFYKDGKLKWINICNSCRDQINTYELDQLMKNERAAVEEVLTRSGFPFKAQEEDEV